MSSNSSDRSRSLDSGVTPRRLYHVVLPDPGNPIVSTTYPRGDLIEGCSAGGVLSSSGCVSTTIVFSGVAGSNGTVIGSGTLGIGTGAAAGFSTAIFTGGGTGVAGSASG